MIYMETPKQTHCKSLTVCVYKDIHAHVQPTKGILSESSKYLASMKKSLQRNPPQNN